MIYELVLTRKQLEVLRRAMGEYTDLRCNKWYHFVDEISTKLDHPSKSIAQNAFEKAMHTAWGGPPVLPDHMAEVDAWAFFMENQLMNNVEGYSFTIEVNSEQAALFKGVLEEYFRLRMNQWFDFSTEVAQNGYVFNKDDPDNRQKFDAYIKRRNEAKEAFETAMAMIRPRNTTQSDEMLIAQDIWQVLRYRLYLDRGGDPHAAVVDARQPLPVSEEPLPEFYNNGETK